jgi:glycosyltransferase involved in cell wall biosynthesis
MLLTQLKVCAERIRDIAKVGVVIVDDTPEGLAKSVVQDFLGEFALGLAYDVSGHRNISIARNRALELALDMGDWIAMTDDDCEPDAEWLSAFLNTQRLTAADAVTGSLRRRAPDGSPQWLLEQPFLELGITPANDGEVVSTAATNCSMVSAEWLRQHPNIRFDPSLGVLGGEDMVFYRSAKAEGLKIHYSANGFVYENQPASRVTYRYQIFRFYWEGNSSYVTCVRNGLPPWRMLIHGLATILRALKRPISRILAHKEPQWRYCLAEVANGIGKVSGFFGVRVSHH